MSVVCVKKDVLYHAEYLSLEDGHGTHLRNPGLKTPERRGDIALS